MAARSFVVQGLVQGVGYRAFVQRLATRSGVNGEVWNRSDGGVEIFAEHSQIEVLQSFGDQLRLGPGTIEEISIVYEAEKGFADFQIGHTR